MSNQSEQRSSFRILEQIKLRYEVIPEMEFVEALKRADTAGSVGVTSLRSRVLDIDSRLDEALYVLGRSSPDTRDALDLLNQKLRIMMQMMPELQDHASSLADAPVEECELSADSIAFRTDENLPATTKLKLRFFIVSESRFFETLAYVHRTSEDRSGDQLRYRVVACFQGMATAERDNLFQHLFSMQSETLRMRRLALEEADIG